MLVELKNGETLNGHLVNCDTWMNLTLKEVVQTSPEGDKFHRLPEVYVRGNNVRFNWSSTDSLGLMISRSNISECQMRSSIRYGRSNRINKEILEDAVVMVDVVTLGVEIEDEEGVREAGDVAEVEAAANTVYPRFPQKCRTRFIVRSEYPSML